MTRIPILVTGSHKAGTTWVGEMLAASRRVGYISEPFNPMRALGMCNMGRQVWFKYIPPDSLEDDAARHLARTLSYKFSLAEVRQRTPSLMDYRSGVYWARHCLAYRLRGVRPLLKDPIAVFSAEWLAETFGAQVVVLIRHPAAFADSLNRAGWNFDFSNFLRQPLLMEHYLDRFADEIRAAAARPMDILDQASLLWRVIYHTVYEYQQAHPAWYFVRHEDLSLDPIAEFRQLFRYLDLPFSDKVGEVITDHTSGSYRGELKRDSRKNAIAWTGTLTAKEISRLRGQVDDVAHLYYADTEWG